jgi:hypothetical protein
MAIAVSALSHARRGNNLGDGSPGFRAFMIVSQRAIPRFNPRYLDGSHSVLGHEQCRESLDLHRKEDSEPASKGAQ